MATANVDDLRRGARARNPNRRRMDGRCAMTVRHQLIRSVRIGAASLIIATFATAQEGTVRVELGSCAAYSGLPSDDSATAGMAFIRGGAFVMGSERHRPEER